MSLLMRFDECAVRFGFVLKEVVVFTFFRELTFCSQFCSISIAFLVKILSSRIHCFSVPLVTISFI